MVMTPAIMLIVLSHTNIKLEIFSVVIIDECHNGVGEQSYRGVSYPIEEYRGKTQLVTRTMNIRGKINLSKKLYVHNTIKVTASLWIG